MCPFFAKFKKNFLYFLIIFGLNSLVIAEESERLIEDEADVCEDRACMPKDVFSATYFCAHTLPYIQKMAQVVQTMALGSALYGIVRKKEKPFLGGVSFYLPSTFLEVVLYRSQVAYCSNTDG